MTKSRRNRALVQVWVIWAIAASLTLDSVTDLSPVELFYKGLFVVITVSAVSESWSWIKHRRTKADLPTDA
ncbi:hypothetical protein [Streptomyces sp. NPDC048349]|uniref:hypothetical protein n=1 Tax=Streptomyces sp. NPDC048349 TaxID=3155486 RepID=UPI00342FF8CB